MSEQTQDKPQNFLAQLTNYRAFWPVLALIIILVVNRIIDPEFFSVRMVEDGRLVGSLIVILNRSAPVLLLSIGMTLVIATKGIDLSVGAVIAICGAVAAVLVSTTDIPVPIIILISIGGGHSLWIMEWNTRRLF